MKYQNKRIITDVDGVLLAYEKTFSEHMGWDFDEKSDSYRSFECMNNDPAFCVGSAIRDFNSSPEFSRIPPLDGAIEMIEAALSSGYKIDVITSCGGTEEIHAARIKNLKDVFGDVFTSITCLPLGASKRSSLERYKNQGHIWLDDSISHYRDGLTAGLGSRLVTTPFNRGLKDKVRRIESCADLIPHLE
ncbi:MAG: hypothetical protein CMF22_11540 [Idiomarinaceae bacterium]|mgnify:CR=1 FL=1|nr:hypothetical protein [Idiomarinaceae bacterium]|tara:strand:- start:77021 stop:77590 length:570 start_codon:yes stop_codon:yes gene_type:complete